MVSLSTIYGVTIVLGSLAAMGSAYVGTKVYPIQTGGDPLAGATALAATVTGAFAAAEKALTPAPEPLATETVKEQPQTLEPPTVEETPVVEPPTVEETPVVEPPAVEETPVVEPPAVESPVTEPPAIEESPPEPEAGGKRKLPPWFKHK